MGCSSSRQKLICLALLSTIALVGVAQGKGAQLPAEIVGPASIVDADTIDIRETRIRFEGIDAFEARQLCYLNGEPWRCGQKAALALSDYLGQRTLHCSPIGTDRYKRILATCWVANVNINAWLVQNGWALAYRRYSEAYVADEDTAKANHAGAWAGTFEAPWDWRKR